MGNKPSGEPRVYKRIDALIRQGLPNLAVLALIRKDFPQHRTSQEQVRYRRTVMRFKYKNVPSSVGARRNHVKVRQ